MPRLPQDNAAKIPQELNDLSTLSVKCRAAITKAKAAVTYTYNIFITEEVIGPHQCDRIINAIANFNDIAHEFYRLLDTSTSLPEAVTANRYNLLMALNQSEALISKEQTPNITMFRDYCRGIAAPEQNTQRLEITDQLEELKQILQDCSSLMRRTFGKLARQRREKEKLFDLRELDESRPVLQNSAYTPTSSDMQHIGSSISHDELGSQTQNSSDTSPLRLHPIPTSKPLMSAAHFALSESEQQVKVDAARLRRAMLKSYDLDDLEILCADLYPDHRVRYPDLKDGKVEVKILRLIEHCERDDKYEELVNMVLTKYPKSLQGIG